jgi:rhodanese-related sulfurtransferase
MSLKVFNYMTNIAEFILNHWILSSSCFVLIGVFLSMEWIEKQIVMRQLKPIELIDWVNHHEAVLIDTRTPAQFQQGHITNAINMDPSAIDGAKLAAYREKPIILVCASGRSVLPLGKQLKQQGFKQVMSLAGGMQRWQTDSLPVVKR